MSSKEKSFLKIRFGKQPTSKPPVTQIVKGLSKHFGSSGYNIQNGRGTLLEHVKPTKLSN